MTITWSYVLVGFIVGMCMSYSGVGAGAITTPLLIFLGVGTNTAIGSDLLFALGTKIVAVLTHMQKRTIQWSVLWRLSAGGLPGAIIGVSISAYLHHTLDVKQLEHVLRIAVAVALLISATGIIFNRKLASDVPSESKRDNTWQLAHAGLFRRHLREHHLDRRRFANASAAARLRVERCPATPRRDRLGLRSRRAGAVADRSLEDR